MTLTSARSNPVSQSVAGEKPVAGGIDGSKAMDSTKSSGQAYFKQLL